MFGAVLQVGLFGASGPHNIPIGSAFLVDEEAHALTARHVIDGGQAAIRSGRAQRMVVGLAHPNSPNMRSNFTLCDFDIVSEDEANDVALLLLRQNPFRGELSSGIVIGDQPVPLLHGTAALDVTRPDEGIEVAVSGYPLSETALVTNSGILASAWAMNPSSQDIYLVDVETNPGNSGGPVYRISDGRVIGLCHGSKAAPVRDDSGEAVLMGERPALYSSGLTITGPIRFGLDLLDRVGR